MSLHKKHDISTNFNSSRPCLLAGAKPMGENEPFDDDAGSLALQTGEFLAGVLALSRISRVTVALEPGEGAGAALLAAARLTGHAETCLLFDRWDSDALRALTAAVLQADAETDPGAGRTGQPAPDQALPHALQALQNQSRRSFLLIFDRFDRYLALPPDDHGCRAFDQAFVQIASDNSLDAHFLLVLDEGTEFMLERFQDRIPGISDGCLRIPHGEATGNRAASATLRQPSTEAAPVAQRAPTRDRSFGMLLERLTAGKPALAEALRSESKARAQAAPEPAEPLAQEPAAQPGPLDSEPEPTVPDMPAAETAAPELPNVEAPAPQVQAVDATTPETPAVEARAAAGPAPAVQPHMPVPEPILEAVQPVRRRPRKLAAAAVLGLITAVAGTVGVTMYRQPPAPPALAQADSAAPPAADSGAAPAATQATPAPAPSRTATDEASEPADSGTAVATSTADGEPREQAPAAVASQPEPEQPPAADSAAARPMPAVYIHVRNAQELQRMQALARTLAARGIRVIEVKVVNRGPDVADFRYFRDEDRNEAAALQKTMLAIGVPVAKLSRMEGFENRVPRHRYEAWLGDGSKPRPSRR